MQFGGPVDPSKIFYFVFGIDEIAIDPGLPASDDIQALLTSPLIDLFIYNGVNFSNELQGVGSSADNLISSLLTLEGSINPTQLWASFADLTPFQSGQAFLFPFLSQRTFYFSTQV